jgi:hypothetical protein
MPLGSPPVYDETYGSLQVRNVFRESCIASKSVYEVSGESAPLAAALAIDKPKLLSQQMIRLYLVCLLAYLSIISFQNRSNLRLLHKRF